MMTLSSLLLCLTLTGVFYCCRMFDYTEERTESELTILQETTKQTDVLF